VDDRAFLGARECLQVKRPGIAFDNCFAGMQLRQLAPNVVRDVVVRMVKRILDEILYAHN
jgi:hypothetical protein